MAQRGMLGAKATRTYWGPYMTSMSEPNSRSEEVVVVQPLTNIMKVKRPKSLTEETSGGEREKSTEGKMMPERSEHNFFELGLETKIERREKKEKRRENSEEKSMKEKRETREKE